jgi:hypothetical protein
MFIASFQRCEWGAANLKADLSPKKFVLSEDENDWSSVLERMIGYVYLK